ncbi:disintegrin and metalloproteinase domain-containing protein 33 [Trichosurus vulpecula]|uniref:disintegrin and metalloproteinase domain-containing protein 33 n=1 Tax=Trichosurus vulpecula TaxID=9337 RepID=UPI00186AD77E|nr:disintegrin and metalloproteinase domain-containing protein 33 [Trichosurus vulpecula]
MGWGSDGALGSPGPGTARWPPGLRLLLLLLPLGAGTRVREPRGLPFGEPVTPHWVLGSRSRREISTEETIRSPDEALLSVRAEGKELLLSLKKNRWLLAQGYTETHYGPDGQPVTVAPNHTDHCYYHGHVQGFPDSWVALSSCSGISGLIVLSPNSSYYVQPPRTPASGPPGPHRLFRTEHLPSENGTCGHALAGTLGLARILRRHRAPRVRRDSRRALKYLELFIVADHALYLRQQRDLGRTKQRLLEIANYVDKFYRSLNIKVALTGLEVWTERDQSRVTGDANATLWAFLQWRRGLRARRPHDTAQLLTGRTFQGTTIGMAPLEGMCSAENSGGVSADHSELPIGAAATMAHEIGHSFGMSHDADGCCEEALPEEGGCVMAAATGHPFPRVFSACSRQQLQHFFQKGGGMCLFNPPDPRLLVLGGRCGNGFLEDGEECDCGDIEECTDPCCHAHNCTLREGAQCAQGDCCAHCSLKPAGTLCREEAGDCDLPEFCTGASPHCPANVYLLDGSPCAGGTAYCRDGMCPTHEGQCQQLWGPGAHPAPDACFQDVNSAGDPYGNCGQDSEGHYVPCDRRDAKCGKLQCQSGADKPRGPHTVSMETTIRLGGREVTCRGAFMYRVPRADSSADLPDPGLVLPGTKCGDGMVCHDRRCQNASFPDLQRCLDTCHGHGVCNSNRNCHCDPDWAPPTCEKPGLGGSVDSGPVQYDNHDATLLALLLVFMLLLLPSAGLALYYYRFPNSLLHQGLQGLRKGQENCRYRTRVTRSSRSGAQSGLTLQNLPQRQPNRPAPGGIRGPLSPKPGPSQPVNVVRPLRPSPSKPRDSRPARPPPPLSHSPRPAFPRRDPGDRGNREDGTRRLLPPKRPLPVSPARGPKTQLKKDPPSRPLPGDPVLVKQPPRGSSLLVMVPPSPARNPRPSPGRGSLTFKK